MPVAVRRREVLGDRETALQDRAVQVVGRGAREQLAVVTGGGRHDVQVAVDVEDGGTVYPGEVRLP